jgi:hypothetical protein
MPATPELESAILHTLAYADVFDYPLMENEIHRFLTGLQASRERVVEALRESGSWIGKDGTYVLPGRESLLAMRRRRAAAARRLWPKAAAYGRLLAGLPFVRMVAVTGSLAVDNCEPANDIDYLIVTAPGRLWTCRALALLVSRLAGLRGVRLCPNYLISETNLELSERSLYVARELAQMIPLSGLELYDRIRRVNAWTDDYLPNARGMPDLPPGILPPARPPRLQRFCEALLSLPVAAWFEAWESRRKIRRLSREQAGSPEARFSADLCKGHADRHGQETERAFQERLERISAEIPI